MQAKKIPLRMCSGCGQHLPKKELVRVVRSPEGSVSMDLKGKAPGRGMYICPNPDCLKKAIRSRAISRSLEVEVPETLVQALTAELEARGHA